jgi:hypothetical protein
MLGGNLLSNLVSIVKKEGVNEVPPHYTILVYIIVQRGPFSSKHDAPALRRPIHLIWDGSEIFGY